MARGVPAAPLHTQPVRQSLGSVGFPESLSPATLQGRTLLADDLFAAYFGPGSPSRRFRAALGEVSRANAAQDFLPAARNDPDLHFDAERLGQGRARLVGALREALAAAQAGDHALARQRLGAALHALQVRRTWGTGGGPFMPFFPSPGRCLGDGAPGRDWALSARPEATPWPPRPTAGEGWQPRQPVPVPLLPWSRTSTVTATGWSWGSSGHTRTSSGQGRSWAAWREVRPPPRFSAGTPSEDSQLSPGQAVRRLPCGHRGGTQDQAAGPAECPPTCFPSHPAHGAFSRSLTLPAERGPQLPPVQLKLLPVRSAGGQLGAWRAPGMAP